MIHFRQAKKIIAPGVWGAFYYGLYWLADAAFDPFLNVHYNRLGLNGIEIGWLSMILPFFVLVLSPVISRTADKYAIRVRLLTILTFSVAIFLAVYTIPQTFLQFLPIVIFVSVLRCGVGPLGDSLIARMASKYQVAYGNMRLWGSFMFFITSIGLGILWSHLGFKYMFIIAGIFFIPTAIIAAFLEEPEGTLSDPAKINDNLAAFKNFIKDKALILVTLASFLGMGALNMTGNFIGIYIEMVDGNEFHIGALWGLSALFEVPTMLYSKKIVRKIGYTHTLVISYVLIALGFFGYSLSSAPWQLILFACIRGLGFGLSFVNTVTLVDLRSPVEFSTTYQGILSSLIWGLAPLLAGPVSGFIFENYGPVPLFISCGVICLTACLLLIPNYVLLPRQDKRAL